MLARDTHDIKRKKRKHTKIKGFKFSHRPWLWHVNRLNFSIAAPTSWLRWWRWSPWPNLPSFCFAKFVEDNAASCPWTLKLLSLSTQGKLKSTLKRNRNGAILEHGGPFHPSFSREMWLTEIIVLLPDVRATTWVVQIMFIIFVSCGMFQHTQCIPLELHFNTIFQNLHENSSLEKQNKTPL